MRRLRGNLPDQRDKAEGKEIAESGTVPKRNKSFKSVWKSRKWHTAVLCIFLPATFLVLIAPSLYTLHASPYHFDEAYSIYLAKMPWMRMETLLLSGADTHPPLYNNILKLWISLSDAYLWAKLSSVLMAVASLLVVYAICRENINETVGFYSVLLMATSGLFISYGGFVSLYMLYLLASSLSVYFFLRMLRKYGERDMALYVLATVAGMFVHWFFAYVLISEALFFLLSRRDVKKALGIYGLIFLFCIALVPYVTAQVRVLEYASVIIFSRWVDKVGFSTLAGVLSRAATTNLSGALFLTAVAAGTIILLRRLKHSQTRRNIPAAVVFLGFLLIVPVLLAAVLDRIIEWNFFVDRHFIFMLIPLAILPAYVVASSNQKALALLLIAGIAFNGYTIAENTFSSARDSQGQADELAKNARYDIVLHISPFTFFPSVVYDWDNRSKHKILYYRLLETNPVLDYAIKSGVLDESNFIQSCDDLIFKNVTLADSGSWTNAKSLQNLQSKCYWENYTWRDCHKRYWNGSTWRDCTTPDCIGDCRLR
jgi:mannosyltransferase